MLTELSYRVHYHNNIRIGQIRMAFLKANKVFTRDTYGLQFCTGYNLCFIHDVNFI